MNKTFGGLFNEYTIKARFFPAIISVLPLVVLKHFFINHYFSLSLGRVVFDDVSVIIILIYLLAQINRFVSKTFFENKNAFPSVQMLLPSNGRLSEEYRKNLVRKIKNDFDLTLPSLSDENKDPVSAKTKVKEIVRSIVHKVKDGRLLLQFNIEYGFVRNLVGGSTVAAVVSLLNIALFWFAFPNKTLLITCAILFVAYFVPIIFSKRILNHYSNEYAEMLIREYLEY